jgi:hypothetical protein
MDCHLESLLTVGKLVDRNNHAGPWTRKILSQNEHGSDSDTRAQVPDTICVGNFSLQAPCFKMRQLVEARILVCTMEGLPEPTAVQQLVDVLHAFYYTSFTKGRTKPEL